MRPLVTKLLLLLALAWPHTVSACAVCFGKSDSTWNKAVNFGVVVLLGVVLLVLGGIAAFFVYMAKRARMLQITTTQEKLQP
jgi:maltodextrin utilization protein YvdJ